MLAIVHMASFTRTFCCICGDICSSAVLLGYGHIHHDVCTNTRCLLLGLSMLIYLYVYYLLIAVEMPFEKVDSLKEFMWAREFFDVLSILSCKM